MDVSKLFEDETTSDSAYPSELTTVEIVSGNDKMVGTFFTAQGVGPHPTLLFLHGFPGTENNFDCAHALNRTGLNVLIFHYRGTWGSEGAYSFINAREDVRAAFDFLHCESIANRFRIDRKKLLIAGNSVGGFLALSAVADGLDFAACISISTFDLGTAGMLAAANKREHEALERLIADCIVPTRGSTVAQLMDEIKLNCKLWSLPSRAEKMADCEILLIAGQRDTVGPAATHYDPLLFKLLHQSKHPIQAYKVDADHSFLDKRIWLTSTIADWLKTRIDRA